MTIKQSLNAFNKDRIYYYTVKTLSTAFNLKERH